MINAFMVSIGLLLITATAATVLAEERQRGGLDVLLATPLTTHEIVMGKWWGLFRPALFLAILPTFTTFLGGNGSWVYFATLLQVVGLLAFTALCISGGVLCAILFSNLGRAVGVAVTGYLLLMGLPILTAITARSSLHHDFVLSLACVSPFMYSGSVTASAHMRHVPDYLPIVVWFVVAGAGLAAWAFRYLGLRLFAELSGRARERY
jgi:ABC-type transport system involved in multi-copper enzyme maturation permease subunit